MKRHTDRPISREVIYTAAQDLCPDCQHRLNIIQVICRPVESIEDVLLLKRRDKRCQQPDCPGQRPVFFAPRDIRIVLPNRIYGLDVTLHIGERHLSQGVALAQITRDLNDGGLPIDQRHTGRVFRDFLALASLARGDEATVQDRLRDQGGIVLMCDGVQFDDRSPVLYMVWDAISGTPLFGERKPFRGEADLVPLLERVLDMKVPVIGAVTDKEKGLVPAVKRVFPEVPYQFCHTHYLKNCARPLKQDTSALGVSVRRRAEAVRKVDKRLSSSDSAPEPEPTEQQESTNAELPKVSTSAEPASPEPEIGSEATTPKPLTEEELVQEVCELVRVNSRVSGKAPLDPPELKRHERLESIRNFVDDAKKKPKRRQSATSGLCSTS